jgi:transcriptional regulator with XRE-family HTH domain
VFFIKNDPVSVQNQKKQQILGLRYYFQISFYFSIMLYIAENLKFLRKDKKLTQAQLSEKIGVKRSVLGAYEEGRAEPKYNTLLVIADHFKVSIDDLLLKNLANGGTSRKDYTGTQLRILPITVNPDTDRELVPLVPIKAQAGYTKGYGDAEYIGNLPQFALPFPELARESTYRLFQTEGDSMLPIPGGAYVITEYLSDWTRVRSDECYVVLTRDDGMVFKRVINRLENDGHLLLKSDNPAYSSYIIKADDLLEIWKVLGYISFELPDPGVGMPGINELRSAINAIQQDLSQLKTKP